MRQVLADPDLRAELIAKGLAQARRYSWERSVQRIHDIYEAVAAG
jgi:glycosyltransferase involved in cell wall biosynthesis